MGLLPHRLIRLLTRENGRVVQGGPEDAGLADQGDLAVFNPLLVLQEVDVRDVGLLIDKNQFLEVTPRIETLAQVLIDLPCLAGGSRARLTLRVELGLGPGRAVTFKAVNILVLLNLYGLREACIPRLHFLGDDLTSRLLRRNVGNDGSALDCA